LLKIVRGKSFVLNEFFESDSLLFFNFEHFFDDFVDFFISYTAVNDLIDVRLSFVNDSNFSIGIKSKPYFSKTPHKFVVFIGVIKKLSVIIGVFKFRRVDGPVADNMFETPIILLITSNMMKLDLTRFMIVGFEEENDVNKVDHAFDRLLARENHRFDGLKTVVEVEIRKEDVRFVRLLEKGLNLLVDGLVFRHRGIVECYRL
jgi:hypothetical protein